MKNLIIGQILTLFLIAFMCPVISYADVVAKLNISIDVSDTGATSNIPTSPVIALQPPVITTLSGPVYILKNTLIGTTSEASAKTADLMINNVVNGSVSISNGQLEFKDVELTTTVNVIKARVVDKDGNKSEWSTSITLTLTAEEKSVVPDGSQLPVLVEIQPGTVSTNVVLSVEIISTKSIASSDDPLLKTIPKGRSLFKSDDQLGNLQIVDIKLSNISGPLSKPLTISLPIMPTNTTVEPWYFDEVKQTWTQENILDWHITKINGTTYLVFRVSHLSIFGVFEVTDITPPVIEYIYFNQNRIYENDYVASNALLNIKLTESQPKDSGIASWNVSIKNVATGLVAYTKSGTANSLSQTILTYQDLALSSGKYYAEVSVADSAGNATTNTTQQFQVETEFQIKSCLNGPNPFNPNKEITNIQYQLTKSADVNLYIYSISGEMLAHMTYVAGDKGGSAGFNSVTWDGTNRFSEVVANGVYIAYIIARDGDKTVVGKVKIAVLK